MRKWLTGLVMLGLALSLSAWLLASPPKQPPPATGATLPVRLELAQRANAPPLQEGDIYVRSDTGPLAGTKFWQGRFVPDRILMLKVGHALTLDDEFTITVERRDFWTIWSASESYVHQTTELPSTADEVKLKVQDPAYNWGHISVCAFWLVVAVGLFAWLLRKPAPPPKFLPLLPSDLVNAVSTWDPEARALLPADLRINEYLIVGQLGAGGMAAVYKVTDPDGTAYALKIPHAQALESASLQERFRREITICVGLLHPNIIRTFDAGFYEGPAREGADTAWVPYMVMELVSGGELEHELSARTRAGRQPDLAFAVSVAEGLLSGLSFAHERGIVHRDIKPSNILLTSDKGIKIMDFGIAHATMMRTLTATGTVIGTPSHMAPEQIGANGEPDARTDVYAAGVVLFELLTHRLPFPAGSDPVVAMVAKMNSRAPAPSTLNAAVGPELNDLVLSMLETAPEARCPSAAEALQRLRACNRGNA